jgi:hypothetical protein
MKTYLISLIIPVVLASCSEQSGYKVHEPANKPASKKAQFNSFEISYSNGWFGKFSLMVDSNKIFVSPGHWDTAYYGLLPDSLFNLVEKTVTDITNKSIIPSDDGCISDCTVAAIKMVVGTDTTRITQHGELSPKLYRLINPLEAFLKTGRLQTMRSVVILETEAVISPPPPRVINK